MALGWPWPVLRQAQFWKQAVTWEKVKTMDFPKTIAAWDLKKKADADN